MPNADAPSLFAAHIPNGTLADADRIAALRLIRSDSIGPITYRDLIDHFGTPSQALAAIPKLSARGGLKRSFRLAAEADIKRELAQCATLGITLTFLGESAYPPQLAAIDGAPPVLFSEGDAALLAKPAVAIVGSRQCTAAGVRMAELLAAGIGAAGYPVVSGLARGIDGAAHQAALATGTVAVLAGGLDVIYPPEHARLHRQIAESGCLVGENPPGLQPRAKDFPRRNRIISGLALAVIIVEATDRSGSLVTARYAGEQGREVFAVPGHPLDPRASGTNALLKAGATIVTEAADVVSVLGPLRHMRETSRPQLPLTDPAPRSDQFHHPASDADVDRVYGALGIAPTDVDTLARATGLPAATVRIAVLELDLAGRIARPGYGLVARAATHS